MPIPRASSKDKMFYSCFITLLVFFFFLPFQILNKKQAVNRTCPINMSHFNHCVWEPDLFLRLVSCQGADANISQALIVTLFNCAHSATLQRGRRESRG